MLSAVAAGGSSGGAVIGLPCQAEDRVYDRWIRLNIIHDVAAANVTVFVDGERRLEVPGHGGKEHYFKFGVYTQGLHKHSHRMEAHWKNVAIYTKP